MTKLTAEQKLRRIIRSELKNLHESNNTIDPKILKTAESIQIWTNWLLDKDRKNTNEHIPDYIKMVDQALKIMKSEYEKIK